MLTLTLSPALIPPLLAMTLLLGACMTHSPHRTPSPDSRLASPPSAFMHEGKRIVYEDSGGEGPVVLCVPGLGDTRGQFRFLAPRLVGEGYRVIAVDPRGQGDSDTGWDAYGAHTLGDDLVALIRHLDLQDVRIIGNSAGAAVGAWVAAELPETVRALVLIGPFVRDVPLALHQRIMLRAAFAGPWAPAVWKSYYKGLYPSAPPADLEPYAEALAESLRDGGRLDALKQMMFTPKTRVAERLGEVRAPALVVMGALDPDFPDPSEEARLVAGLLRGEVAMIPAAGHYPHVEFPDDTFTAIQRFLHAH